MTSVQQFLKDKDTKIVAIKATGTGGIGELIIQRNGEQFQTQKIDHEAVPTPVQFTELNISTDFLCFAFPFGQIQRHSSSSGDYYDHFVLQRPTSSDSIVQILQIYSEQVQMEKNRADAFLKQLLDTGI